MNTCLAIAFGSLIAIPHSVFGQGDAPPDSVLSNARIMIDAGYNPFGLSDSWGPRYSVRVACHLPSFRFAAQEITVNVSYTQFGLEDEWATGIQHVAHYPSVRREDVAIFLSTRAAILEFGLGVAYVRSDPVRILDMSNRVVKDWPYGNLSELTYYASFGFVGDINLAGGVYLPLGFHYVVPTKHARVPYLFRAGIGYQF